MARFVHFEYYVDEPQKALEFYEKVFDWKSEQSSEFPYWLVTTGPDDQPGINGGIGVPPAPNGRVVVNTLGIEDIDDAILRAEEAGAGLVLEKRPIPGMGWVAYLSDPAGVPFGVYMQDESAA